MPHELDRRQVLAGLATAPLLYSAMGSGASARGEAAAPVRFGEGKAFSFEALSERARTLARQPHVPGRSVHEALLDEIDYDPYQQIRYRADATLMVGAAPVQLFHLGKFFKEPVRIHLVADGTAREVIYDTSLFDMPGDHPARRLPANAGFAGFRVMAPDLKTDWIAFLGASYFRTSGPFDQYGLSARALAIDTGMATPEEFPRFAEIYLEAGEDAGSLVINGLIDSPSATGAIRMATLRRTLASGARSEHTIAQDIAVRVFARRDITRLGIAPFSSMYWYGEGNRALARDWRPEIHDSDGLAVLTGAGERLWRPLNNPPRVMVNAFVDRDIKGFGLLQRDRSFANYLDDGVFYDRRASVWVQPTSGWGEGTVQLLEIPTDDEIHDNIAAYWSPARQLRAGDEGTWRYLLTWAADAPDIGALGRTVATHTGMGGRPGQKRPPGVTKYVIDFSGAVFDGLDRESGVVLDVTASRGTLSNMSTYPVVGQERRWRAMFDINAEGAEPVDLRLYLKRGEAALSETWLAQHFPRR